MDVGYGSDMGRTIWGGSGMALLLAAIAACGGSDDGAGGGGSAGSGATGGTAGGGNTGGSAGSSGGAAGGGGGGATGGTGGSAGAGGAPTDCNGDCHFVRSGATGSGDGSDWDNAYPDLPSTLTRGHTYLVAAGDYAGTSFDDAAAGGTAISIVRATIADHGTDTGWNDSFASGEAKFGPLEFKTADWDFDGRNATRVIGDFQSTVVDIGGDRVTFANVDVDGAFAMTGGKHTAGACTGMNATGNDVTVAGCKIHDAADDGVSVSGASNALFQGNWVYSLHGCGTDGGCGPCYNGHSDGFEIFAVKDSQFIGNFSYDVASTSTFFFGNWADELGNGPSDYCQNILLANNILYSYDTGFVAYIEDANGVQVMNNVMWGQKQGAYGGLSLGTNVKGLDIVNNVILSINYTHIGGSYDAAEHHGDYNFFGTSLGQWTDGAHDQVGGDPGFSQIPGQSGAKVANPTPEMFKPKSGSPLLDSGTPSTGSWTIPATDFFGKARDNTPNIGAIE